MYKTDKGHPATDTFSTEVKVLDPETGRVSAVASTEAVDREGDIIRVAGWDLTEFSRHPVLLNSHRYGDIEAQIGEWESLEVQGKRLMGVARYYIGKGNAAADWGFNLALEGKAAFSVGFIPDMSKAEKLGDSEWFPNYEFNGQKLLEVSAVAIPANAQALQQIKALSTHPMIDELVDELLKDAAPVATPEEVVDIDDTHQRIVDGLWLKLQPLLNEYLYDELGVPPSGGATDGADHEPLDPETAAALKRVGVAVMERIDKEALEQYGRDVLSRLSRR